MTEWLAGAPAGGDVDIAEVLSCIGVDSGPECTELAALLEFLAG